MPTLRTALAVLVLAGSALSQGRIVVAHDEWTLSNTGFSNAPGAGPFVRNVADWFTGGQPGVFRAWSTNFGVTESSLAAALTSAGHTWSVSTAGVFDLATLQQYDGIFVVGTPVNAAVLTQYVQAGGNVYVAAGTGGPDPSNLNPFLQAFGFELGALNGYGAEAYPISSAHPIFSGVSTLYHWSGNSISLTAGAPPQSQVLVTKNGLGLYAVHDGAGAPSVYCTAKANSLGCTPAIAFSGQPSASSLNAFTISASNVVNQKQGLLFYGYAQQIAPFQGGFLCAAPPTRRTPAQNSGGAAAPTNDCSGAYAFDFNGWIQSGADPLCVPGQTICAQYWSRDPASPSTTGLTNAVNFVIGG